MNTKLETEDPKIFSYLDIEMIRNVQKKSFETPIYRKSTFTSVFTNFESSF